MGWHCGERKMWVKSHREVDWGQECRLNFGYPVNVCHLQNTIALKQNYRVMVLVFWRQRLHSWPQTWGEMHQQKAMCDIHGRAHHLYAALLTPFLPKHCRAGLRNFTNNFQIAPAFPSVLESPIVILVLLCLAGQVLWRGKEINLTAFRLYSVQRLNCAYLWTLCLNLDLCVSALLFVVSQLQSILLKFPWGTCSRNTSE